MENLWPDDLLEAASKHVANEIEQALISQAEGLSERTHGLLTGVIRDRTILLNRAWAFGLYPTNQPAKETQLFIVRSQDGKFPVVLESFDGDGERYKKISGLSAFRVALQGIFLRPQTKRIVKLLATDANIAGVANKKPLPKRSNREARSISLGSVAMAGDKEVSHVSIFGVSGFITKTEVLRFLMKPDQQGSSIETLNDKYVITFSFIDSCKVTITEDELRVFQAESRKAIG